MTQKVLFGFGDLPSTIVISLANGACTAVVATCVVLGQDTADDVRDQALLLASLSPEESGRRLKEADQDDNAAIQLRSLRARQQALHDVVQACNFAHGGASLCCLVDTVIEAGSYAFMGIEFTRAMAVGGDVGYLTWAIYEACSFLSLMFRFVVACILGQQLCKVVSLIEPPQYSKGLSSGRKVDPSVAYSSDLFSRFLMLRLHVEIFSFDPRILLASPRIDASRNVSFRWVYFP